MKPTEQEIKEYFVDNADCFADAQGLPFPIPAMKIEKVVETVQWAISQMQLEWVPVPPKQLLDDGFYYVKLFHPETKVEGVTVIEIGGSNRIINYHYAIAYCPIPQPPTK